MKRVSLLLLILLLCCFAAARADDTCLIDATSVGSEVTTDCSYIRVTCPSPNACEATLTVRGPDGSVCYQRSYQVCTTDFTSEEIYLRMDGKETRYQLQLEAGTNRFDFTVVRRLPRMENMAACSTGYPLSSMTGDSTWKSVTMIDVQALEGRSLTVPLQSCGSYEIGCVTFSIRNGQLTATAQPLPGVDIHDATVFAAASSIAILSLNASNAYGAKKTKTSAFSGMTGSLNQPIDLYGAPYIAVYLELNVSFDPLSANPAPALLLDGQYDCWMKMLNNTDEEAVG